MSFILDALKKSETDRQQQGSAEFAGVPTSQRREPAPRWLWVLGVLLAINVIVLLGLLLRPGAQPDARSAAAGGAQVAESARATPAASTASGDFARQVAAARQNAPAREEPGSTAAEATPALAQPPAANVPAAAGNSIALPTIHEVVANGLVTLPELHVDVHVYSEASEDRFVFINMNKHTEGSRLIEGPLVREITRDGVVLVQDGTTFLLPRD